MYLRHSILLVFALALLLGRATYAANSPPVANPDAYSVNEDATLSISSPGVLANDTDAEGNSITALLVSTTTNGTLTLNSSGSFTYRPVTNFNGADGFIYRAKDSSGTSAPVTVTITVNAVNDVPRATNDSYSIASDTTLVLNAPGVLANDFDADGTALSTVLITNVAKGSLTLNENGSFTYTPQPDYFGTDSFAYRAFDGTSTSAVAVVALSVLPAPIVITAAPSNTTACPADNVTFSVTASGTALRYQWQKGTTNLVNKTNSTLVLPNVVAADAGTYRVRVIGATNSITNSATLTINTPVTASPLTNAMRAVGGVVVFATTATGTSPYNFTWLKDGVAISGETSNRLMMTNLTVADSGVYSVVVANACRSVTNSATLTVAACFSEFDVMLVIDRSGSMVGQPYTDARAACTNFVYNLRLHATNDQIGLASFNPTSTLDRTLTTNAASMLQAISALPIAEHGTCISCGLLTGQQELVSARHRPDALPVLVLLSDGLPHDFDTPSNALYNATQIKMAGTRLFTVGLGPGVDPVLMAQMASSTNDYFYANTSDELAGLFDAISTVICRPPTNIFGPGDVTVCAGANIDLTVNASGCASFAYQWLKNGSTLAGQTNKTLSISNARGTNSGVYSVIVSGSCRKVTNSALVTVNEPALVVTPPGNQLGYIGSNAVFSVNATGTSLTYEWRFNGAVVGTNSTLVLNNLTPGAAGTYCVTVGGSPCGSAVTACATLTLLNRAPVAANDAYTTDEDTPLTIAAPGVLANDSDIDGDAITAWLVGAPANGSVLFNNDGSFTYTPKPNFNGIDPFTYFVSDGRTNSGIATVAITVNPINDRPVAANDDQYTISEDTLLVVSATAGVLANDSDLDGDLLSAVLVSTTTNGTLVAQPNGSFTYLPNTNFHGIDHFTYRASDGVAQSDIALVTIVVTSVNDTPVAASDDQYTIAEDTLLSVSTATGVLANDLDVDGDALSAVLVNMTTNGTLLLQPNGSFTYLPGTNFHGVDYFTYRATDGVATSSVALVTITITSVNDTPVAANDDQYMTAEDTLLNIDVATGVLANDVDVDGDTLTAVLVNTTTNGTLALQVNGSFAYLPNPNFHGVDHFTYRATDGTATSALAVVTITVGTVNDAPVAQNDSFVTDEDVSLVIGAPGVLANDSDLDGDTLNTLLVSSTVNGALTLNANGSFTYLPATNFHGVDSFTYRVTDGFTNSGVATVTITIRSVNDTPVPANDDQYVTQEDTVLTVSANSGVLSNDTDADADTLSAVLVNTTTNGVLTLQANGSFTYLPNTNFHGVDHFTYRATDGVATSGVAVVTINVLTVNDVPVARNDAYTTDEDVVLTIAGPGVLANDSDSDGDTLTTVLLNTTTNGTLTLSANGAFVYRPATNFNGTDSFTYRASDGQTNSGIATVTITINSVNDTPVPVNDDNYLTQEDTMLSVPAVGGVLSNDIDVDGTPLTAILVNTATNGTLVLQANGSFTYLPNTNFHGVDHFTYRATDGVATSVVAVATITVLSINDVPVARNDSYATDEDVQLVISAPGILTNDTDSDGDTLSTVLVNTTTRGTLSLNANGSFTYSPGTNFHGTDTFTYRASDGQTNSAVATVTITVNSVNDTPLAVNDDRYSTVEDTLLVVPAAAGVLTNDIDVDGDVLTVLLVNTTTNGTLSLQTNGAFTYLPATNFNGTDHFTYRATDGLSTSTVAVVTILVGGTNDAPVARDDSYVTDEDVPLFISAPGVLANDSDNDNDPLTTLLVTGPAHGTLTLNANGSFTYVPATNFNGTDSFTYRARDFLTNSGLAVVTITVNSINDSPVAANDDNYATTEDTLLTVPGASGVLANDLDVDGDVLRTVLVTTTTNGTLTLQSNGSFGYMPNTNFHGVDYFTYRATDGVATSAVAVVKITVQPLNDVPVARNDSYTTDEDVVLTIAAPGVLGNDSDVDGDILSTVLVAATTNGSLTLNPGGSFTYRPTTNFHGVDTFTYRATDGSATSSVATVTITVNSVNDTPVAANNDNYSTLEDTLLVVSAANGVLTNDLDVDGDTLSAVIVSATTNGTITLNANGSFAYLPNTNFHGVDHFTYRATDGAATSAVAVVTITTFTVNDAPVAQNDSYTTAEDTSLVLNAPGVLANDSDQDGDLLSTILVNKPLHGSLTLNANGSFIYTPETNYHGSDSFTYRANDGQTNSGIATVTITIDSVNDAPVAANDDQFTTSEDTLLVVPTAAGVLTNDYDLDGDPIDAVLVSTTTNGILTLQSSGGFIYLPNTNFHGVDHFSYRATDGLIDSGVALVSIVVRPVNDAPVARNDAYTTDEDIALAINLPGILANDSDQDNDALTASLVSSTTNGTLTLNSNGSFVYLPATNFHGVDAFTYRASDGQTNSAVAVVTITVRTVNDPPVSREDGGESYSVLEDQTLTMAAPGVLANDSDQDGDILTASLITGPGHGSLTLNANGSFTYVPAKDYFGNDSFTYVARDASTSSTPSLVTIVVKPVNDAPSFVAGANQRVNYNTGPQTVVNWAASIKAGPTNEASQTLNFIVSNNNPTLFSVQPAISPSGTLTYTPSGNSFGAASVTVSLKDNGGTVDGGNDTSAPQAFSIILNGPPTVSIAIPTNGTTLVGTNNLTVLADANDPDSVVTNVQLFVGTNLLGSFTNLPYLSFITNAAPAIYSFYAVAADDLNLRATSSVVTITITASPPVSALGPIALNRQNGLFEQYVRISNPTPRTFPNGMRLFIFIDTTNRVFNATGTNAQGTAYIDVPQPLPSGSNVDVLVQYVVPNSRSVPTPILKAEPLPFTIPTTPAPNLTFSRQPNGPFTLRFSGATNRLYMIESSSNFVDWIVEPGLINGTGTNVFWSSPPTQPLRFYRVLLLPY